jgi:hypothetical protein
LAIVAENYERIIAMLLAFRSQMTHPNPRRAITFALLTMATIIEVRALERVSMWHDLMPISDRQLQIEIKRNFLAYLCSPEIKSPSGSKR